jgi:hypothetical protein
MSRAARMREGRSPGLVFPRIPAIALVGIVARAPGNEFDAGDIVAAAMGGMGRQFDGGCAEYTCVPATQVQVIRTRLSWETLGATPEMLQTVFGARCPSHPSGRSSGAARRWLASRLPRSPGATGPSSRRPRAGKILRASEADQVFIDTGTIAGQVQGVCPGAVNKVLEGMGAATLVASLRAIVGHRLHDGHGRHAVVARRTQPYGRDPDCHLPHHLFGRHRGIHANAAR